MRVKRSIGHWARAAALSALALGVAAAADDNCRPYGAVAPRRPAVRAARHLQDGRLHQAANAAGETYEDPPGLDGVVTPPPSDPLPPDETPKSEKAADEPKKEEEAAEEEEEAEEWTGVSLSDIFKDGDKNEFTDAGYKLGGNIAQSFTFNFDSPTDKFNGPVTWTDRSNEYQMNQAWVYLEKATTTDECNPFDFGGRADIMGGTNARFNTETGFEDQINRNLSFYGLAVPNLYLEAAYQNVKVKAGRFISPVGYFTVDTTQNFFNTIPYTYQYGEPFTHTGALATVAVDEHLSLGGGVIRGWDAFDGSNPLSTPNAGWLGTATYTFEDKSSIAYVNLWSHEPAQGGAPSPFSSRYFQTFVWNRPIGDNLTYVFQSDYGQQVGAISGTGHIARWYGMNQYLMYKVDDKWSWGVNFEWFRDEEGFRVGGFLPTGGAPQTLRGLPTDRSGYQGNFFQCTFGPKWSPTKNMFLRPNVRLDWFDGEVLNAGGLKPYDDGNKNHQAIFGTDLVITF